RDRRRADRRRAAAPGDGLRRRDRGPRRAGRLSEPRRDAAPTRVRRRAARGDPRRQPPPPLPAGAAAALSDAVRAWRPGGEAIMSGGWRPLATSTTSTSP